jgi:energy-coupling factor transporter ATP-binding protein EcfA2
MPKATNLIEAYNNFVVEPLKTEEEFRDFYVERPKGAPSPIEELKDRIENAESAKKYLFLGFRGCGKSTELNRLSRALNENRFLIVSYSIRELDVSDFDFRDFFASMALKIYDIAEKEIELERDIKEDFRDFMMRITKVSEKDITRYRKMGISFSKFILLKLGREAKTREYIRKELETKISDLIQRLNWLTMEVESKLNKIVVVIVDDLDKLARGQQAGDFFYKNYGLLIQPNCFVIYTFPIPLTFNQYYENVRHAFDDDIILPQLPVRSRDRKRINKENFNFYKQVVEKRMDLGLIEEEALKDAILSTGKTSEFISVMRDATIKAYRNENERITKEEVGKALEKLRRTYDRTLTEAHKRRLLVIYDKKEARDENISDSTSRDLLFSLTAVEYEDEEGRWCDINPLLLPLVEKWKKA